MKFKNFRSAIHNFAHSFQSVDYTKSGKLALNVLIKLNNDGRAPQASFDFINRTITPVEAITLVSDQLLSDYINWLPVHLNNHNCDFSKLHKLHLIISANFEKAFVPSGMVDCKQLLVRTEAIWKAENRDEEKIEISCSEIIAEEYLKNGIPEM